MIDFKCIAKSAGIIVDDERTVLHIRYDNFIKYSEMVLEEGRQRQIRSEQALIEMTRIGEELNNEL
jgi:hypothetical protein